MSVWITPVEQIQLATRHLEERVTDLIKEFEKATGVYVSTIQVADFINGTKRHYCQPLKISLLVEMPTPIESKQIQEDY
jgi:hypothetical protein